MDNRKLYYILRCIKELQCETNFAIAKTKTNRKGWMSVGIEKNSYEYTAIRICVDAYETSCIQGKIYSPFSQREIAFQEVTALLVALETIADDRGFPEPMYKYRKFPSIQKRNHRKKEAKVVRNIEDIEKKQGQKDTIRLFITGRRNAGIQGHFMCLSTGNVYKYSSELQLLQYMEEVLCMEASTGINTGTQTN